MRPFLVLFLLLPPIAWAQEETSGPPARERAFLEVVVPGDTFFLHQIIGLRLRIGVDRDFFKDHAVQPFRRPLDVPVQLEVPWFRELPGAFSAADGGGEEEAGPTIALNGEIMRGRAAPEQVIGGRVYTVVEIEKSYLPEKTGVLEIPASRMSFIYAMEFHEDMLQGRIPRDRRTAMVAGRARKLRIDPLPDQGRPAWFDGAVGRFTVRAETRAREATVGEVLKLTLHFAGRGNLAFFTPPRLDGLAGFHVYGRIEERRGEGRAVTYDLVPLHTGVKGIPPIPFAFFDPPRGYRTVRTRPIPLAVKPMRGGRKPAHLPVGPRNKPLPGRDDIYGLKDVPPPGRWGEKPSSLLLMVALLLPWIGAGALLYGLRVRERARRDVAGRRARGAAAAFSAGLARPNAEVDTVLAAYLAARLRCPEAAVIGPELPGRLVAAGIPRDLAIGTARSLEALVAGRYGGEPTAGSHDEARALVAELETHFQAGEVRR